jgi:uncharacterized protein YdeI (YjbR/CyaY-like superfamily)
MNPTYFASAADFRRWLEKNHDSATELSVAFYKKASGKSGLTYAEAVDELLCFGWIDGVLGRIDHESYTHRITPRRKGSIWSNVNIRHVARLTEAGRMHAAGHAAFAVRRTEKSGIYLYEKTKAGAGPQKFPAKFARVFRAEKKAWSHWLVQPPGYQRTAIYWVTSAKQTATQDRRLAQLIALSAKGRRLAGK